MERECITLRTFKIILDDLRKETDVISEGTDYHYEGNNKKHFYWITFKNFEEYPQFVGRVHNDYGRNIDIKTCYEKDSNLTMFIRGLKKELR